MNPEQRTRTRVPVQFDVAISLGDQVVQARILNVSLNGLLCTAHPLFRKDAPCRVTLSLSDASRIVIDARVSRAEAGETAIRFLSMDGESFLHLKRLVQYNADDADRIDHELRHKAFD